MFYRRKNIENFFTHTHMTMFIIKQLNQNRYLYAVGKLFLVSSFLPTYIKFLGEKNSHNMSVFGLVIIRDGQKWHINKVE